MLASFAGDLRADIDRAITLRLARSVAKVEVTDANGRFFLGTGTVVAEGKVVTACHVTRTARKAAVLYGGLRRSVASQHADPGHDLCVLDVPGLEAQAAELGSSAGLSIGETVLAIGFTGGAGLAPALGSVEHMFALDGGWIVQTDAGFSSGASGGGLFDGEGRLVGILMFRMRGRGPQFFAVPVEWFRDALADTPGYRPLGADMMGEPFWRQASDALPYFMQANSLRYEERWDDLRALAQRWHESDPAEAEPLYVLGELSARTGGLTEAIEAYRAAVSLNRRHALAWFRLGMTYLQVNRIADARAVVSPLLAASQLLGRRLIDAIPEMPD